MKRFFYNMLFIITFLTLSIVFWYDYLNEIKLNMNKDYEERISLIKQNLKADIISSVQNKEKEVNSELTYNILKDIYVITDSVLIKSSYDFEEDIINSENILNKLRLSADNYYNEYTTLYWSWNKNLEDLKITLYYKKINKMFNEKSEKLKEQRKYFNNIQEVFTYKEKVKVDNLNVIKQNYNDNTCMYNSLNHLFQLQYWKVLDKNFVYNSIWKKVWDYWNSWLFQITEDWWKWLEDKSFSWSYSDFYKLKDYWIISYSSANYDYIYKKVKEEWKFWVFEWPMYLFDNRSIWRNEKKNIWHAVAIVWFDGASFSYADSLDWKIKQLPIERIMLWNGTKNFKYPIRFITFNNKKILENKEIVFKN